MTIKLNNYIAANFPGLQIRKPVFYSWYIGIRFELGPAEIPALIDSRCNEEYFYQVVERAKKIFSSAFNCEEEIWVVYQRFSHNRQRIKKNNYCFLQVENIDPSQITYNRSKTLYEEQIGKRTWKRATLKTQKSKINHHNILTAIANKDFGDRPPKISGEVYFISPTRNIILHMYDDRGLDIIAKNKKDLFPLYQEFNDWILEYDREEIDQLFKNT